MICPLVWVGCLSFLLLLCYCQFLLLCLLVIVLYIECSYVGCIDIYHCYVFLLDWSLYHYLVSYLISCNILYFKVYFVWYEDCYSSFPLLPICMEYIFSSHTFILQNESRSEVGFLQNLVFVSIQPVYVFWLEHLIHLHLKQLLIYMVLLPFS